MKKWLLILTGIAAAMVVCAGCTPSSPVPAGATLPATTTLHETGFSTYPQADTSAATSTSAPPLTLQEDSWSLNLTPIAVSTPAATTDDWEMYRLLEKPKQMVPYTLSIPDNWVVNDLAAFPNDRTDTKVIELYPTILLQEGQSIPQSLKQFQQIHSSGHTVLEHGAWKMDGYQVSYVSVISTDECNLRVISYYISDGEKVAGIGFYKTADFTDDQKIMMDNIVKSFKFV